MGEELYKQVIGITESYLGPAADRFVARQVSFHLKKKPAQISKADLPKLAEWMKVSLGLLTEDKTMVDECENKIMALAK